MAEKIRYPQIPSTVWWGVRSILQKTPSATVDERLLGVQLGVQDAAARAYINELKSVGMITDEGKATPLAHKWRLDDTYSEAVGQLVQKTYPEGLVHLAPPGEAERQKVVSWFQREGFGQGAAGNKAATYLLLSSPTPDDSPRSVQRGVAADGLPKQRPSRRQSNESQRASERMVTPSSTRGNEIRATSRGGIEPYPLNVNVQIHISADAGTEQIESIFQAMRRYLHDAPDF